ncbi:MAG: hypothetical protein C4308_01615 [Chitinophagaceae bacterium]
MKKQLIVFFIGCFIVNVSLAQDSTKIFHDDSTRPQQKYLADVTVVGRYSKTDYQQMPEVVGTNIYTGKKMP